MKLDATVFIEGLDILKQLHKKLTPDVIIREVMGYPCYLKDIMGPPADDPPPPPLLTEDDELLTIDIFLGTYNSANRSIKLFSENIQRAARLLDCEEEDLEYVVRFHEHAHALIHLGVTEADRWEGLRNGRFAALRLKRLTTIYNQIDSSLHEHLAQLVTYQVLKKLSEDSEDHIVCKAAGRMRNRKLPCQRDTATGELLASDVSPENDSTSKLEYDGGFGGPLRKEGIDEAVTILRRADRLCHPASQEWDPGWGPLSAARRQRRHLLHLEKEVRASGRERTPPAAAGGRGE